MSDIETPSGKNEETENFPVARFVRATLQPHVMAFYTFARAADDISDNPLLEPEDKIKRLDAFATALLDKNDNSILSVIPLRESLQKTKVTAQHALDLLTAFKRDATKLRYENWDELLDYCRYSA
ncbi:MAG TPA: squalene synthase HpnC, partial [Rhodospirillaceae bacterium]|nr:squalene synthase HpnC [Rhodospirillaceae bacterium]